MLIGELVYRGVNPDDLPLRHAMAYMENREEYYEMKKRLWMEAAKEIFDGGA